MTKKFCLLNFIFQEPYILWSWLMVHMCKRIIYVQVFFFFYIFSKFWFLGSIVEHKSKKWAEMTKGYVCASTPYLSKHTSYDRVFLLHKFKIMTSPDLCFIFLKFWFCGLLRRERVKKAKNGPKWQKILSHFISQELYRIWLWFLVNMCKIMTSPANLFIFLKSDFFGFSKFINKCQIEILRCVPPSAHLCDFSVKLWLVLS